MSKRRFLLSLLGFVFFYSSLSAASAFSGFAGGKLNYSTNQDSDTYDPELKLQAFFAGQFSLSQNTWSHLEFSIDSGDFLNEQIFHKTDAKFQVDEFSLTSRMTIDESLNYLSAYMGTFDAIGSDTFLERYFNIEPISSKLTESWLGLAGSILYPHFGAGLCDVFLPDTSPFVLGGYLYVNHEDSKYFVANADFRTACSLPYLTWDFACGVGAPLANKYQGSDVIVAIDTLYWHAGTTILFGNNYTGAALFMQAGIFNAAFTPNSESMIVSPDDIYFLFEPRFLIKNVHIHLSAYSIPQDTVDSLLFIDDSLGVDLNFFSNSIETSSKIIKFGIHISYSYPEKTFYDFKEPLTLLKSDFNINITPYISTDVFGGEMHAQVKVKVSQFTTGKIYNAISCDIGYKTSF